MRINNKMTAAEIDRKAKNTKKADMGSGGAVASPFAARLSASVKDVQDIGMELKELKDAIDKAADDLDREPTVANFRVFRDLLSNFAKKATSEAYRIEKIMSSGITPHEHELVTIINKEADDLYRLIVSEQQDRLAITGKLIRIKGLVVDFLT